MPRGTSTGINPLCGDHYTVYVKLDGERIVDVSFEGAGCAISKASASVMSAMVKVATISEAEELFQALPSVSERENSQVRRRSNGWESWRPLRV